MKLSSEHNLKSDDLQINRYETSVELWMFEIQQAPQQVHKLLPYEY